MELLILDLLPVYISFEKQATKADGTKINPTVATVRIFEEGGADAAYDNSEVVGSPFTCNIINAKVGNYGVLVAKSLFTAGKIYRVLHEWTVDTIPTADDDVFHAINASQFMANVTNLDAAITSRSSHSAANVWSAGSRALSTPNDYKADISALPTIHTANAGTAITGGVIAGTFASTAVQDNNYWQIECRNNDNSAALIVELEFNIGTGRSPVSIIIHGRIESDTDKDVDVWVWDYDTYDWEKISTSVTQMKHNINNKGYQYNLFFDHHDHYVASHGDMIIRFIGQGTGFTSAYNLYLDEVIINTVLEGSGDQPDIVSNAVWGRDIDTIHPAGGGDAGGDVADIKAQTDLLPADPASETNVDANETKIDTAITDIGIVDGNVDTIVGKLPTNEIMGSSVKADKDDEIDDIKTAVEHGVYGLEALKDLLLAIDTSTELAARFTEIKGAGWVAQTLVTLQTAIDASVVLNDITTRGR